MAIAIQESLQLYELQHRCGHEQPDGGIGQEGTAVGVENSAVQVKEEGNLLSEGGDPGKGSGHRPAWDKEATLVDSLSHVESKKNPHTITEDRGSCQDSTACPPWDKEITLVDTKHGEISVEVEGGLEFKIIVEAGSSDEEDLTTSQLQDVLSTKVQDLTLADKPQQLESAFGSSFQEFMARDDIIT